MYVTCDSCVKRNLYARSLESCVCVYRCAVHACIHQQSVTLVCLTMATVRRSETSLNLSVVEVSSFTRRHGSRHFVRTHSLKGRGLIRSVGITSLERLEHAGILLTLGRKRRVGRHLFDNLLAHLFRVTFCNCDGNNKSTVEKQCE